MPNIPSLRNSTTPMWDKTAKIPIIGNVTSFVRIPVNVLKGLFAIINYVGSKIIHCKTTKAKAQFKASISGFSKGIMGAIPIIGTIAAIYLFKNNVAKPPDKQENVGEEVDKSAQSVEKDLNTSSLIEGETDIPQQLPRVSKRKKRTTSDVYPWSEESIRKSEETPQQHPVGRGDGIRDFYKKGTQKLVEINEDSRTLSGGVKSEETNPQVLNFKRKLFTIDIETNDSEQIVMLNEEGVESFTDEHIKAILAKIDAFHNEFSIKVSNFKGSIEDKKRLLANAREFLVELELNESEACKDKKVTRAEEGLMTTMIKFRNAKLEQSGVNIESTQAIAAARTNTGQKIENKKKSRNLLAKIKAFNKEFTVKARGFKGSIEDKERLLATASKFLEELEKNESEALKDAWMIDAELELITTVNEFRRAKIN